MVGRPYTGNSPRYALERYCRPVIGGVCSPHEKLQQSASLTDTAALITGEALVHCWHARIMVARQLTFSMAPNEAYTGDLVTESKRFTCVDTQEYVGHAVSTFRNLQLFRLPHITALCSLHHAHHGGCTYISRVLRYTC